MPWATRMQSEEGDADASVVAAITWAIVCVDAWIGFQALKRSDATPPRKMGQDAAAARAALSRAAQLAWAAPPDGPRYRVRKEATETLQDVFCKNEAEAERGELDARARIEAALEAIRGSADEWG
jgi:hypothetical protein